MKQDNKKIFEDAFQIFSPMNMASNLLIAEDGTKYFDRSRLILTDQDMSKFIHVIDPLYLAKYTNILDLTVYFEVVDDVIWAGTYNLVTKEKESRRPLISSTIDTPYTYVREKLNKIKGMISNP